MSPVPLGIWAVAGASGGSAPTPAYDHIESITVPSGVYTVTFATLPTTYKHLKVMFSGASNNQGQMGLQFNGDANGNYGCSYMDGNSSSLPDYANNNSEYRAWTSGNGQGNIQTLATGFEALIADYRNTNTYKTVNSYGMNTIYAARHYVSVWRNTAAITSISLNTGDGPFTANSLVQLYGIRG